MNARLLPLILAVSFSARAQAISASGPMPASFIPRGYRQLPEGRVTGDLNGDGRPDVVLALAPVAEVSQALATDENEAHLPPRLLLVLVRTATGYQLAADARRAILYRGCGGMYGDPFAGLSIAKGVLSIHHYGGSSWRWAVTGKFRYQRGDFYQIGETYSLLQVSAEECPALPDRRPGEVYRDTNLLTGTYESVKVSEDCELLENRRGRQPRRPLRKLTIYEPTP